MPQRILILFSLLALFLHSSSDLVAIDPDYLECSRPLRCKGSDINVSFPFSLPESRSQCGFPGYELHCSDADSDLSINLAGVDYRVKGINYNEGVLNVVNSDFLGNSCPQTFTNTSINSTLFDFGDLYLNLTVYINCSYPIPGFSEISCFNDFLGLHSHYKVDKGPASFLLDFFGVCQLQASVPVDEVSAASLNSSSAKFGEVLKQGFGLKWTAGKEWCRGCIDSGGVCGSNSTRPTDPICICQNNTALGSCHYYERRSNKRKHWVFIGASIAFVLLLVILMCVFLIRRWKHRNKEKSISSVNWGQEIMHRLEANKEGHSEISLFQFTQIVSATDNFSDGNKLGEGGFGPVYKGKLPEGQVVAIKRLSARSGQGLEEFKNEILLIAKLQHRNLVRLFGCCIHGEEKMLIYEFMPNKSLDLLLFNVEQGLKLDWTRRFQIIEGIAQGLLYLHRHSRLRIIHRDLKASNILLDVDMNPKISDFGLARIFDANESQAMTRRIVGTYGYMSPEYAYNGLFSVKSDAFSFGVLLLEIVSGRKSAGFRQFGSWCNLLTYAWDLWKEGKWVEFVDPTLDNKFQHDEVARCIYVALLCVQEGPDDRPIMTDVITMLGNVSLYFDSVKQPGFYTMKNDSESISPLNLHVNASNDLSVSAIIGR